MAQARAEAEVSEVHDDHEMDSSGGAELAVAADPESPRIGWPL